MNFWRKIVLFVIAILLLGVAGLFYTLSRYELSVTTNENQTQIHTLSLGEYYSPIKNLTIKDNKNEIVVCFTARRDQSMMHTVSINAGFNEFKDMYLDGYEIQPQKPYFKENEEYTVSATWPNQKASTTFTLNPKQ